MATSRPPERPFEPPRLDNRVLDNPMPVKNDTLKFLRRTAAAVAIFAAVFAPSAPAFAQGWEFSLSPYFWVTGLKGDVGVFPSLQPVDVDLSFGDIMDNFDFGAMLIAQARHGRWVIVTDFSYIDVGADKEVGVREPPMSTADLDQTTFTSTIVGGYSVVDRQGMLLDLVGGVRINAVDTSLDISLPNGTVLSGDSDESWIDPVVGARAFVLLSKNWSLSLYGDIGGFGASSDITWQLLGTVQFALSENWSLVAGWRHYEIDYSKGGFVYDVAMDGPLLGLTYRF